jgi:hypothetical protein
MLRCWCDGGVPVEGRGEMSEPTLSLAVGVGDVAAGGVCEKHTILFPLSHTGGLFHPYKHVCPFCRAERAEARVKVLEEALWKRWEDCICGGDGLIRCYNGAGQSHLDDCNKCADIRKALRGEEQGK